VLSPAACDHDATYVFPLGECLFDLSTNWTIPGEEKVLTVWRRGSKKWMIIDENAKSDLIFFRCYLSLEKKNWL
jgi:hypothetical protein